jgi:hypothetical protein
MSLPCASPAIGSSIIAVAISHFPVLFIIIKQFV